jgi:hypothetical protein
MPWRHLGERRYSSYSFTTLALDGDEWSASRPGHALPLGKVPPVPIVREAGWAPEPIWIQSYVKSIFSVIKVCIHFLEMLCMLVCLWCLQRAYAVLMTVTVSHRTGSLVSLEPNMKMLVLQLDKWGLDDAHKDKQNKVYTSDFKVSFLGVGTSEIVFLNTGIKYDPEVLCNSKYSCVLVCRLVRRGKRKRLLELEVRR